jgi:hypothetical protein
LFAELRGRSIAACHGVCWAERPVAVARWRAVEGGWHLVSQLWLFLGCRRHPRLASKRLLPRCRVLWD